MNKLIIKQNIFEHNNILRKFPWGGGGGNRKSWTICGFFYFKSVNPPQSK